MISIPAWIGKRRDENNAVRNEHTSAVIDGQGASKLYVSLNEG